MDRNVRYRERIIRLEHRYVSGFIPILETREQSVEHPMYERLMLELVSAVIPRNEWDYHKVNTYVKVPATTLDYLKVFLTRVFPLLDAPAFIPKMRYETVLISTPTTKVLYVKEPAVRVMEYFDPLVEAVRYDREMHIPE